MLREDAALVRQVEELLEAESLLAEAHSAVVVVLLEVAVAEVSQADGAAPREVAASAREVVAEVEQQMPSFLICFSTGLALRRNTHHEMCSDGSGPARSHGKCRRKTTTSNCTLLAP